MNIFVLDLNPALAAQYQADKHIVKMVLESAQLLCSPFEPDDKHGRKDSGPGNRRKPRVQNALAYGQGCFVSEYQV